MKLIILTCLTAVACNLSPLANPRLHKFEDGFVERTVAIIVRDKTAEVEYSIGLNETTVEALVAKWDSPAESHTDLSLEDLSPSDPLDPSTEKIIPSEKENLADSPLAQEQTDPSRTDQPRESKPESTNDDASASDSSHFISPQLLAKFQSLAPTSIAKGIKIHCNDQPITIKSISVGPAPRHPFTMTVNFEFEFPDSETCNLKIVDENFGEQSGAVRYALKAAGKALLLRSDVAPILIRADRIELAGLRNEERVSKTSINAKLGFPK